MKLRLWWLTTRRPNYIIPHRALLLMTKLSKNGISCWVEHSYI